MSWYYTYYIGYQTKDGKLYPLGPFDHNGRYYSVLNKSRSFASDLHHEFYPMKKEMLTDELFNALKSDYDPCDEEEIRNEIINFGGGYLPLDELPKEDSVITGYFPIDRIAAYLEDPDPDLMYDRMSSEEYALRLSNYMKFQKEEKDEDEYSITDYALFSYTDYNSIGAEVNILRQAAHIFDYADLPEDSKIVILLTQG